MFTLMNRFPGGSFDVSNVAKGPRDEAAGDGRYKGSAKVRILWGGEQMWEIAISAPWFDGETSAEFQRRVLQMASRQMAELALAMNQASAAETTA
jgi:stress-induced morphogen